MGEDEASMTLESCAADAGDDDDGGVGTLLSRQRRTHPWTREATGKDGGARRD